MRASTPAATSLSCSPSRPVVTSSQAVAKPTGPSSARMRAAGAASGLRASAGEHVRPDRDEVGLREVPVVVGLLLRAVRREPVGAGVVVVRLLDDARPRPRTARSARARRHRSHARGRRTSSCSSAPCARGALLARLPHGHVDIAPRRFLLHLSRPNAELDDRLPQELKEEPDGVGGSEMGASPRRAAPRRGCSRRACGPRPGCVPGAADVEHSSQRPPRGGRADPDLEVTSHRPGTARASTQRARRTGRPGSPWEIG